MPSAYVVVASDKAGKKFAWHAYRTNGEPLASGVERDTAHDAALDAKELLDHGIEIRVDEETVIST